MASMRGWGWAPGLSLVLQQLLLLAVLITSPLRVGGDPANLVSNGDFEDQSFTWDLFPQMDVLTNGIMNFIPYFTVVSGGVQVMDGNEYVSPPWEKGNFLLHLNCWLGPGRLKTTPLSTPRWGATYNLTFDLADNPDGGPLDKALAVHILVNDRKSGDGEIPIFNISNPETQRRSIIWQTVGYIFVGTGETTTIVFESLVPGAFGVLIDNVKVTLISLLDNGSFDLLIPPGITRDDATFFNVLRAPNGVIRNWAVTAGAIKWSSTSRWQGSTDGSDFSLDLNAESVPGTIISGRVTLKVGARYVILFDTAANPDSPIPVSGELLLIVQGFESGNTLSGMSIRVDGNGFSPFSVGWRTDKLEFIAKESIIVLTFASKIPGEFGPLLDNTAIYMVSKVGSYYARGVYDVLPGKAVVATYSTPAFLCSLSGSVLLLWAWELLPQL